MSDLVLDLSRKLRLKGWRLVTAESCTGGLVAAAMTDLSGSSAIFDRGFVTYSNEAKQELLGIMPRTLKKYGAVSRECADAMAKGALKNSRGDISVSITGIAGPTGGSDEKPVGLVYIATAIRDGGIYITKNQFEGDRAAIRTQACEAALQQLSGMLP